MFFLRRKPSAMVNQTIYIPRPCYDNSIYVKENLLPYKNTIGKTGECYVLSVVACSTTFFVNCTSVSVNFEKIKVIVYESIHFKYVFTFIPYSLWTSQFSFWRSFLLVHFQAKKVWELGCMLGVSLLIGAYNIVYSNFQASNQGQQSGGRMSSMEFFLSLFSFFFLFKKLQACC